VTGANTSVSLAAVVELPSVGVMTEKNNDVNMILFREKAELAARMAAENAAIQVKISLNTT
jgi:hypothetical protein